MTRQNAVGIFFILLISGAECVRVVDQIKFTNGIQQLSDAAASVQSRVMEKASKLQRNADTQAHTHLTKKKVQGVPWLSNFGNSVCPDDQDVDFIALRFKRKSEKLQLAASNLKASGLVLSTLKGKMSELLQRTKGMSACAEAVAKRPELKQVVDDPDSGLRAQMAAAMQKIIHTMNSSSLTSWEPDLVPGCSMPMSLEEAAPGADAATLRKLFYGEKCDVAAYKAKQSGPSLKLLNILDQEIEKLIVTGKRGGIDAVYEQVSEDVEKLEEESFANEMPGLLQLDDSIGEGDSDAVARVTTAILIVCGCFVAFFAWILSKMLALEGGGDD